MMGSDLERVEQTYYLLTSLPRLYEYVEIILIMLSSCVVHITLSPLTMKIHPVTVSGVDRTQQTSNVRLRDAHSA